MSVLESSTPFHIVNFGTPVAKVDLTPANVTLALPVTITDPCAKVARTPVTSYLDSIVTLPVLNVERTPTKVKLESPVTVVFPTAKVARTPAGIKLASAVTVSEPTPKVARTPVKSSIKYGRYA